MCINTFLTLSPLAPYAYTYDPAKPGAPYGFGGLYFFGGYVGDDFPYRLADQYNADEVVLGFDAVAISDQSITNVVTDVYRRSAMRLQFRGTNVSTENQYLLIFHLRSGFGNPHAQFFVGTDLVRTEEIIGEQQVALLVDVPGNLSWLTVYVRLAADSPYSGLGIKGVDIYLL